MTMKTFFSHFAPPVLIASLGRCGKQDAVAQALKSLQPSASWFRLASKPYALRSPALGVDLMLQCLNAEAPPAERLWGVHSWSGPARTAHGRLAQQELTPLLGEPLLCMDGMAVFEGADEEGQRWCAHGLFDSGKRLQSLTLMRLGDWLPMPVVEAAQSAAAGHAISVAAVPAASAPAPVTCRSSATVPKTGWYEARLPADHSDFRYFSQSNGRFVRKHEGERMLTLGVVPFTDEGLVVWTWLREG
ncbi:MAG: hypothetical protein JWP29_858 [Rhodoferax sp.]|nr:hypothetical protein [Rhodoferax sp.]